MYSEQKRGFEDERTLRCSPSARSHLSVGRTLPATWIWPCWASHHPGTMRLLENLTLCGIGMRRCGIKVMLLREDKQVSFPHDWSEQRNLEMLGAISVILLYICQNGAVGSRSCD